jgi:hypothetical protein
VEFLDRCGLETGLEGSSWFPQARAGHEHALDSEGKLPYIVKDPVLFTYCTGLDLTKIRIDALIVPVRDLMLAARSRIHQERLAMVDSPWLRHRKPTHSGATPGGVLYSLDVVDQARILAVGFHTVLHWAIVNEIPLFLPEFPRMVEDRDYALRTLWPWLGEHCSLDVARTAFDATANVNSVRIRADTGDTRDQPGLREDEPDSATLDRAALLERVDQSDTALELVRTNASRISSEARQSQLELECLRSTEAELRAQVQAQSDRGDHLEAELAAHRTSIGSISTEHKPAEPQASMHGRDPAPLRIALRRARRLGGYRTRIAALASARRPPESSD